MRRVLLFSLALMALLGFVAPPDVFAQAAAPTPKFSITGFIDSVGTWSQNLSGSDTNVNRNQGDHQMYGRTRGRFDIIGEVGPAKAVFGFEIDGYWGQTSFSDTSSIGKGEPCFVTGTSGAITCGTSAAGAESSFDLNTDTQGSIQVKWLYVEFPLPLVPFSTIARLGAQPFATAASYKLAPYANGDFAGVNLYSTFSPTFKAQLTYVNIDENLLGKGAFGPVIFGGNTFNNKCITSSTTSILQPTPNIVTAQCQAQSRGDNFAIIVSPELTVMKGLDIKPMYSYVFVDGVMGNNGNEAREPRGGVPVLQGGPFAPGAAGIAGADQAGTGVHEYRHTIGVDARWRSGPWSLDPTIYYQFGTQAKWNLGGIASAYGTAGTRQSADISAWLGDIRASYQLGPLLLSAMTMWTTGNDAKSNLYSGKIHYYQPLDTDTSYMTDWGTQIMSLGVDYYQILAPGVANPGTAIGWDKYGRVTFGAKASYAITPALTVGAGITPNWTWNKVDTDAFLVTGGGLQPSFVCRKTGISCRPQGESNYLGTEADLSLTYRFAPGLVFDWAFGYMWAGNAMSHRYTATDYIGGSCGAACIGPQRKDIGVEPIAISTARVRLSF
jgi:hypothetical protein